MKSNFIYFPSFIKLSLSNSILLLVFSLVSAVLQMVTAISIVPIIRELDKNFELNSGTLEKIMLIYDASLEYFSIEGGIFVATLFMLLSLLLFSSMAFYIDVFTSKSSALIVKKLRIEAINNLMNASWMFFRRHGSADAVNHIITEASKISVGYQKVIETISNFIQALFLIAFSLTISDDLTMIMLASSFLVILLFVPLLAKSKKLGEEQRILFKNTTESTLIAFDNIKSIKAMSIGHFSRILRGLTQRHERNTYVLSVIFSITKHFRIPAIVFLFVIFYSIFSSTEQIYYASLFTTVIIFERIIKSIGYTQNSYQSFLKTLPYFITFNKSILNMKNNKEAESKGKIHSISSIKFDNVTYSYLDSKKVFRNVNLTFNRSSSNLIVGRSGSGKTTFIDLIIGLIRPCSGAIFINDLNLTEINLRLYREKIGFVPQEVFLFNESLRNNISMGRNEKSDLDIIEAIDSANLTELLSSLPNGLDSNLGEGGRNLSGGQRQRVLIARALLSKPDLLIFDEPTSGLDHDSTLSFMRLIDSIKKKNIIVIIISHDQIMRDYLDNIYEVNDCSIKQLR